jgi:signal transduction histidine kinase
VGTDHVARIERQLAIAQQITGIGSWEWDVPSGRVTWSDELYRVYGLEPRSQEITLEFFYSRLHPADRDRVGRDIAAAMRRTGRFRWNERILHPDGEVRELETIGESLPDGEGAVACLVGTCRDVTDERERSRKIQLYADIVHNVQISLSVWTFGEGPVDAESLTLAAFNPASERIAGMPLLSYLGKPFRAIAPYAAGGVIEGLLARVARERRVLDACVERAEDGEHSALALGVKGFPLPGQHVGLAVEDVTAQTFERRLQSAEHRVLEAIARGASLEETLKQIVLAVEEQTPPVIGSILLLEADGVHVRHGAAPNLPEGFRRAIDGSTVGPHAGSCGTAIHLKTPVIVPDIAKDALWDDYRETAVRNGLRACWSIPILATDERVLGSFAFYYRSPRTPTPSDLEMTARAARLAAIAIERKRLEEELRALSAHVETALEDERTGIAREIHDELGQSLTALKMDIAWVQRRTAPGAPPHPPAELAERLAAMAGLTDEIIQQVRKISAELRPGVLDDLGLVAAIEWQAQEFETRRGTTCVVHASTTDVEVDRRLATAVFRIFQEALTNVTRHACAKHVEVRVDVARSGVDLEVRDDGVGIPADAALSPKSLGLIGIRERAHRFGGTVAVSSFQPHGTLLKLHVPLSSQGAPR